MVIPGGLESHRVTPISSVFYVPEYLQAEDERLLMQKVLDSHITQGLVSELEFVESTGQFRVTQLRDFLW